MSEHNPTIRPRVRLRKRLGQTILVDQNINRKMVEVAGVTKEDLVVEVGAGYGGLTEVLAQRAGTVFAIEIDRRFEPILREKFGAFPHVTIFIGDVLNHDLADLLAHHLPHGGPLKMVSNIPYYVTAPILEHFLERSLFFDTIVVMVQKEVAVRLTAKPGSRKYGVLSLVAQFYADVDKIADVPKTCFRPVPEVDSSIVRFLCKRPTAVEGEEKEFLLRVIRAAFGERRKMLKNALVRSSELCIPQEAIGKALIAADISGERRAETLSLDEFIRLSRELRQEG